MYLLVCFFTAHEAAGAASTRHSLRPLLFEDVVLAKLGRDTRRENAKSCLIGSQIRQSLTLGIMDFRGMIRFNVDKPK